MDSHKLVLTTDASQNYMRHKIEKNNNKPPPPLPTKKKKPKKKQPHNNNKRRTRTRAHTHTEQTTTKNVDKVLSGAHIFQASAIPSNGYIFSTDFSYYTAQWQWNVDVKCVKVTGAWNIGQGHGSRYLLIQYIKEKHYARYGGCRPYTLT